MTRCHDSEGWSAVSDLRDFDLTPCFEEGILNSLVLLCGFVAALFEIWVSTSSGKVLERSKLSNRVLVSKLGLFVLVISASIANLVIAVVSRRTIPVWQSYALELLALLAIACLTWFNHTRRLTSSTVILLFWLFYMGSNVAWARTFAITRFHDHLPTFVLRMVVISIGFITFLLECLGTQIGAEFDQETKASPLLTANIFSKWSFGWMTPLMKEGARRFITEEDLPSLLSEERSSNLGDKLGKALHEKKSLWKALFVAYGPAYAMAALLKIAHDFLNFLQPQLLRFLLSYIADYQRHHNVLHLSSAGPSSLEGFAICFIMFSAAVVQTILLHQYFQRCFEVGMRVRAGLVTSIYNKALLLSSHERAERASGDIVNLMSVDATRLQDFCAYGLIAISGPLQIVLAFASLYNILGWPAFVGVAIMIFSIPLNTIVARILKKMQEEQMKNRDKRTRLMSELLANIKSIKLYAWEFAFIRRVLHVRNDLELNMLKKISVTNSLNTALWTGIPLLVAFSSFAVAAITSSKPLTADVIFPSISLFMLLQFPLAMFAQVTSNIIEAWVSIKRISDFLSAEETQPDARVVDYGAVLKPGDEVLKIREGEFSWSKDALHSTLEDINVTVRKGELLGVLGRVGDGKSSLLSAIVGDMIRNEGEVVVSGNISYCPQNPWIMSTTLRNNILFNHEYDEVFYEMVLDACALRQDLELLPEGDMTEVGEKGITLSGGQRARVALARAVYARADLVLLDDVLAAVDAHVAKHLFHHVIGPNGLLSSKARVFVTNSLAFLPQFNQIVFMRRGIILESGTYIELMANTDSEVFKLKHGHGNTRSATTSGISTPKTTDGPPISEIETIAASASQSSDNDSSSEKAGSSSSLEKQKTLRRRESFKKAVLIPASDILPPTSEATKEHSEQGRVQRKVYMQYIAAASRIGFTFFVLSTLGQQVMSVCASLVLRAWGDHNSNTGNNSDMLYYLLRYGLFSLGSVMLGATSAVLILMLCSVRSARYLHEAMLNAVMRAPLSFFELTPTGRILNLFSRDTYVVDQILGRVVSNLFRTAAACICIIAVIGSSFPPFLIAVIPLGWFYSRVMIYYLRTSRELKRLDAVSRSPIFAWFSESLAGLTTIIAFNQQSVFIDTNCRRIDRNQMCYLPSIAVNRWLAIRLELVGATIILIASLLSVTALVTSGVDAGLVGLVLSYALNTTSSLNWVVRSASEVEQNIVSVERILHYIELTPEAPFEIADAKTDEVWPSAGSVEFKNYSTKYRPELENVLNDIALTIKPKEKIGIVGRTGSGKSSLLLALFRIIEPSAGTIFIDGVDITKVGLHDLRSGISIVPQSPDLFEGSLRENVDPVGEYEDIDIWTVLEQVHLKEYVESLPGALDAPVKEGGSSMSSGQRQLLCFARALLRKSKILVLDEATSAVDVETDRAIQEIIRGPAFADVTMFIVAHRLNTIIDSDRVLVLSAGKVTEFDAPAILLENKSSQFHSLAVEAGLTD